MPCLNKRDQFKVTRNNTPQNTKHNVESIESSHIVGIDITMNIEHDMNTD